MPVYTNTVSEGASSAISDSHCADMACGQTISVALIGTGSGIWSASVCRGRQIRQGRVDTLRARPQRLPSGWLGHRAKTNCDSVTSKACLTNTAQIERNRHPRLRCGLPLLSCSTPRLQQWRHECACWFFEWRLPPRPQRQGLDPRTLIHSAAQESKERKSRFGGIQASQRVSNTYTAEQSWLQGWRPNINRMVLQCTPHSPTECCARL